MQITIHHKDDYIGKELMKHLVPVGDYGSSDFIFCCESMWANAITPFYPAMPFVVNNLYKNCSIHFYFQSKRNIWKGSSLDHSTGESRVFGSDDILTIFKCIENGSLENIMESTN